MIEQFNQFVYLFWICFSMMGALLISICIKWDGFWTFVKEDLGEVIGTIVCLALFAEISLRAVRMAI